VIISDEVEAAPSPLFSAEVKGLVKDMWIANDRCNFQVVLTWTNRSDLELETVDAWVEYFDSESNKYKIKVSSEGWKKGDEVNGTLWWQFDEKGEWYWLQIVPKSNDNYAECRDFGMDVSYFPIILVLIIAAIGMMYNFPFKDNKKN